MDRKTIFDPTRKYRYTLWREWDLPRGLPYGRYGASGFEPLPLRAASEFCMFIGLNPSTADETQDDPTIRRCIRFAKDWGYGAFVMTNLFAFRATDPEVMKACDSPETPDRSLTNRLHITDLAREAGIVVAAWGKHGKHMGVGADTLLCFKQNGLKIHHLGLNGDGTPKHPLYLKATTLPQEF